MNYKYSADKKWTRVVIVPPKACGSDQYDNDDDDNNCHSDDDDDCDEPCLQSAGKGAREKKAEEAKNNLNYFIYWQLKKKQK